MKALRSILNAVLLSALVVTLTASAQQPTKPPASPPASAKVTLGGHEFEIHYSAPSMRGRKIFGGLVPYDHWWRTGANAATSFELGSDIEVNGRSIPKGSKGSYTVYTIPSAGTWKLIINKQTGQWGTEYDDAQDYARIDMNKKMLSSPQEKMSITFENTSGKSTELHIRWENHDVWVPVKAK